MGFQSCYYCSWVGNLHQHHKIHKKDGGTDDDDNIIEICPNCHHDEHCTSFYKVNMFGENKATWLDSHKYHSTNIHSDLLESTLSPHDTMIYYQMKKRVLNHEGYVGITISELAEETEISQGMVSKVINHLIDKGIIERISIKDYRQRGGRFIGGSNV